MNKTKMWELWTLWLPELTVYEQMVLNRIISHIVIADKCSTFVSQQTIAAEINVSRRSVIRATNSMESMGLLYVVKIKGEKHNKNRYRVNWKWNKKQLNEYDIDLCSSDTESQVDVTESHTNIFYKNNSVNSSENGGLISKTVKSKKQVKLKKINYEEVFKAWSETHRSHIKDTKRKKSKFNEKEKRAIRKAVKEYSEEVVIEAIKGFCEESQKSWLGKARLEAGDPHAYSSVEVILRDVSERILVCSRYYRSKSKKNDESESKSMKEILAELNKGVFDDL